jgi:hypothetical protein
MLYAVLSLPGVAALLAIETFNPSRHVALANLIGAGVLTYWIALAIVISAAKRVFVVALYAYAQDDLVANGFAHSHYAGAWRTAEIAV